MKRNKIYIALASLALLTGFTACSDYLDKLPDDRATVDTKDKVDKFLASAYPLNHPGFIFEYASDNVTDNGTQYTAQPNQDKVYRFEVDNYTGNDDPYQMWNTNYTCVATANEALQDIDQLGGAQALPEEYAEALLCRAFAMFQQASIFCMAYNPDSADVYMGLPYPKEPQQDLNTQYERGTLRQLYDNINADIEAALPLVGDGHLTTPKYHFNRQAAYAFGARFNLFYHNYDKAIEYATQALTSNPEDIMRDFSVFSSMSANDIHNAYIQSSVKANFMFIPAYSLAGRCLWYRSGFGRYGHNQTIWNYETLRAPGPWGSGYDNNTLYIAKNIYGYAECGYFPKQMEDFEITDKVNNTGYTHVVFPEFTAEETLLVRAEAEALKGDFSGAISDMNLWIRTHCAESAGTMRRPTLTEQSINTFIEGLNYEPLVIQSTRERSIRKTLHPQGFTVASGTQENIIELILQMRRIETIHEGQRFLDLKRYGIEYQHVIDGENPVTITAGDKRMAFQLPEEAINNGLTANPR